MVNNKSKKGVSAIVATSLIILITVAAISIVWAIVLPMIKGNLYNSQVCSNVVGAITIRTNTGETCWNKTSIDPEDTTGTVYVQIERSSANIILTSLNLRAIDSNGNAQNRILKTDNETIFGPNGINPGDVYVYNQSTTQKIIAFEIIPVITVGTQEYSCNEAIASAEVDTCWF